jgi:hypothetical protein
MNVFKLLLIVIPLGVSMYYILRMIYFQYYDRKMTQMNLLGKHLKSTFQLDLEDLKNEILIVINELESISKLLKKYNILKQYKAFGNLMILTIDKSVEELKKKNINDGLYKFQSVFQIGIDNYFDLCSIDFKHKINISLGVATWLALLSTLFSVLFK